MRMNKNKRNVGHSVLRHGMLQPHFLADLGRHIPGDGGLIGGLLGVPLGAYHRAFVRERQLCTLSSPCVRGC